MDTLMRIRRIEIGRKPRNTFNLVLLLENDEDKDRDRLVA